MGNGIKNGKILVENSDFHLNGARLEGNGVQRDLNVPVLVSLRINMEHS